MADEGIGEGKEIFIYYGQNYFQGMKCLCDQDGCFEKKKKLCIKDEKEVANKTKQQNSYSTSSLPFREFIKLYKKFACVLGTGFRSSNFRLIS